MKTEIVVSRDAVNATRRLIQKVLIGDLGFDEAHLLEMYEALGEADRIVISSAPGDPTLD